MDLPVIGEAPWGFVECVATGLTTLAVSGIAFIWRLTVRLERMSISVDRQRSDLDGNIRAGELSFARFSERLTQMHDDHCRLREAIGALPSRVDLRDLEDRIEERIEALAARFDRAIEMRGV
jgi:hypothetical protein